MSYLGFSAWNVLLAHETWCSGHLTNLGLCLHRVHKADVWIVSEHVVEGVLTINQLELVELHIFSRLLQVLLFGQNFILQLLDQFCVLRTRWTILIEVCNLDEFFVEVAILLIHETACIAKFGLKCSSLPNLFLNKLVHLRSQALL